MKRRTVLVLGGSTLASGLAGCVGDGGDTTDQRSEPADSSDESTDGTDSSNSSVVDDVPEYAEELEECHLVSITYDSFPAEIRAEIDAALEDGASDGDPLLFDRAVDADKSYIVTDDTPYKPSVSVGDETKRLELDEVDAVRAPEPYSVSVENDRSQEYTVELELERDEQTVLDTTVAVGPGTEASVETTADAFGAYTLSVTLVEEEVTETGTIRIGDAYRDPFLVWISEDGIGVTQVVAELVPCPHTEFA